MKVLTYNVRQWYRDLDRNKETYWKARQAAIRKQISDYGPDVICVQEMMWPMRCIPKGYKRATCPSFSHHIYYNPDIYRLINSEWHLHWCRALFADSEGNEYNVFCVHSHWKEGALESLSRDIWGKVKFGAVNIVGGDFNAEPAMVARVFAPMQLYHIFHPTFKNWKNSHRNATIDHFCVWPSSTAAEVVCWLNNTKMHSDHYPIGVAVEEDWPGDWWPDEKGEDDE